jgi:hypothetical protein
MADTVTMSATLKVDGNNEPIQNYDIKLITESDVGEYNLVIFYNDKYYGSTNFNCDYFEGVTINFNVSNDKDKEKKTVTVGKEVVDKPSSGNYVRIKCDKGSKFYDVSETVGANVPGSDAVNNQGVNLDDLSLSGVNSYDTDNQQLRSTELTKPKTNNLPVVSNFLGIFKNKKTQNNQKNGEFYDVVPNDDSIVNIVSNQITTEEKAKINKAKEEAERSRAKEEAERSRNNDEYLRQLNSGGGGKLSRKAYHKSGRKASRKASRTAYRKPSRKAYRKSVGNKKRNRGTRKK